jgi:putative oxidoreductase
LESRAARALVAIRIAVAAMIFVHGTYRLFAGGVAPFGEFLNAQHFPAGTAIAWWITIVEIVGSTILAIGRFVRPLAIYFAAELTMGIILVHRHDGWFVVGGGRNGMEYSVLLISSLLILAYSSVPAGKDRGVTSS